MCRAGSIKTLGLFLGFTFCLQAQLPVPLGTAGSFAVLAGAGVTNTGNTVVNGNLGTSPTLAVTGFPPGIVINGAIYTGVGSLAGTAQSDLTAAYNNAAGRACPVLNLPGDIGFLWNSARWHAMKPFDWRGIPGADIAQDFWIIGAECVK